VARLSEAAARGAAVILASQGARFILQFGSIIVLARLLTPEAFGLVAMVTSLIGVAELIRDFGLSSAAIQAKHLRDQERTNLFWANLGIGATCALVAFVCAPLIVLLYGDPRVRPIVFALAWLLIVSGATTQFRAELSRSLRFKALAVVDVIAQMIAIAMAITAAILGAGYWAIVAQQATLVVTTCLLSVALCRWRPGLPRRSTSIRRFFRFGGGVLGTQVLGYSTNNIDNVALGAVWGPGPLGVYSRAYQLLMVPINQINDPMTRIVLPILSRVQEDQETYQRYVAKAQLIGTYVLATVFSLAAALSAPLVAILFGAGWSAIAPVFAVLAVGGIFRGVGLITYWVFLSRGLTGVQLRMYLLTRPFMIAIILAGLPFGPVGVAAGHSLAFACYWVFSLSYAGRVAGIRAKPLFSSALRSLALISVPAGILAFLATLVVHGAVLQLLVGGTVGLSYVGLALAISPTERRECAQIARLMRQFRGRAAMDVSQPGI
jgi:O-antigen/teichoic acid export membrane protein